MIYPLSDLAVRDLVRVLPETLSLLSNDTRKIDIEFGRTTLCPYILVYRQGGTLDRNTGIDRASIVLQCYGKTRMTSLRLALTVSAELADVRNVQIGNTVIASLKDFSVSWAPDRDTPRTIVITEALVYPLAGS